jgi:HEAT repeat protein
VGVKALLVLVLASGSLLWAARVYWLNLHPVNATAQSLRSRDAKVRASAAQALGESGPGEAEVAVPALIAALGDDDAEVRSTAASSLGASVTRLLLADPNAAGTGDVINALLRALKDRQPAVRGAAAGALSTILSPRPTPYLPTQGPEPEPSGVVDPRLVALALDEALRDPDANVRAQVFRTVGAAARTLPIDPPPALVAALKGGPLDDRVAALGTLPDFRHGLDPLIPHLFWALEHEDPKASLACKQALWRIRTSPGAVPVLTRLLESPNPVVRDAAAGILGHIGPEAGAAIPALLVVLQEPEDPKRTGGGEDPAYAAAEALGRIAPLNGKAAEVVPALTRVLRSSQPWRVGAAAESLGLFGAEAASAVPELIAALRLSLDDTTYHRPGDRIAVALGRIAPGGASAAEAVAALTDVLGSKSESAISGAIKALPAFGPAAAPAIPGLRALGTHRFSPIRVGSREALKALGAKP